MSLYVAIALTFVGFLLTIPLAFLLSTFICKMIDKDVYSNHGGYRA